jgi:cysteine synthase A
MQFNSVDQIINDDIFLKLPGFLKLADVFLKIEGLNVGGSIKLKTAIALVRDAMESRNLQRTKRFIESSSGNLGVSLSIIAAAKELQFTCVVDSNTSVQNIKLMKALGTHVVLIDRKDAQGGYLGNRLAYIRAAIENDPNLVWLNQYQNPANPSIHAEMTAKSVLKEFPNVNYLFVGAGTTGTLMGCARFFHRNSPHTKIVAVDSIGSVTFGTPPRSRYLPGLGASVQPHFFDKSMVTRLVQIPEAETVTACRDIASRFGYLGGASTGTVLAAIKRFEPEIERGAVVVAISPDLGSGYLDTVYDELWCDRTFGRAWATSEINNVQEGKEYA